MAFEGSRMAAFSAWKQHIMISIFHGLWAGQLAPFIGKETLTEDGTHAWSHLWGIDTDQQQGMN